MTGNDDRQGIAAHSTTNGAGGIGFPNRCAERLVGNGLSERNLLQALKNPTTESIADESHGKVKGRARPVEVLSNLSSRLDKIILFEIGIRGNFDCIPAAREGDCLNAVFVWSMEYERANRGWHLGVVHDRTN